MNTDELTIEYKEWMQERWNHPSVVIWDSSNETQLCKRYIDSAIANVRTLDLSGRIWDNSYGIVRLKSDVFESHPYHFSNPDYKFKDIAKANIIPQGSAFENLNVRPVIINEYGWLWLNRDGSPTTLTKKLYENIAGKNSTADARWKIYARYFAAENEFWRCHRKAAGVLHFTALVYGRTNGQTCDNWIDIKNLVWEPYFLNYVSDAFSPIGLMVDFWDEKIIRSKQSDIPVIIINDLDEERYGKYLTPKYRDQIFLNSKTAERTYDDVMIGSLSKDISQFQPDIRLVKKMDTKASIMGFIYF